MSETNIELIAEDDDTRSKFIYDFLQKEKHYKTVDLAIPKVIMQYWHSLKEMPKDVLACIESWKTEKNKGFKFDFFDDESAMVFIRKH